ncbi:energy transducer TonB [Ekhidna sp.]
MKKTLILLLLITTSHLYGQELAYNSIDIDKIHTRVDEPAKHPEGIVKMWDRILKDLKYPEEAAKNGIKGRVFVTFVVEKDGSFSNIQVAKSIGFGCDEEAVRIVESLPNWDPAKIDGKVVRQKTAMNFLFPPSVSK